LQRTKRDTIGRETWHIRTTTTWCRCKISSDPREGYLSQGAVFIPNRIDERARVFLLGFGDGDIFSRSRSLSPSRSLSLYDPSLVIRLYLLEQSLHPGIILIHVLKINPARFPERLPFGSLELDVLLLALAVEFAEVLDEDPTLAWSPLLPPTLQGNPHVQQLLFGLNARISAAELPVFCQ